MDNQHRKISGYRELSRAEIDLMNEIKETGKTLEALCKKVQDHIIEQSATVTQRFQDADLQQQEFARIIQANPQLWCDWGTKGFQADLMYLTRAVAQPSTF